MHMEVKLDLLTNMLHEDLSFQDFDYEVLMMKMNVSIILVQFLGTLL